MSKQKLTYGLWSSPITPAMIGSGIRMNDVQWSPDGETLVWSQSLDGKTCLFAKPAHDAAFDLSGDFNPSGGVGYGGGDFFAGREGVVFAERDGRLYYKPYAEGLAHPITPAFGSCASPVITPDEKSVLFVHSYENKDVLAIAPPGWQLLANNSEARRGFLYATGDQPGRSETCLGRMGSP